MAQLLRLAIATVLLAYSPPPASAWSEADEAALQNELRWRYDEEAGPFLGIPILPMVASCQGSLCNGEDDVSDALQTFAERYQIAAYRRLFKTAFGNSAWTTIRVSRRFGGGLSDAYFEFRVDRPRHTESGAEMPPRWYALARRISRHIPYQLRNLAKNLPAYRAAMDAAASGQRIDPIALFKVMSDEAGDPVEVAQGLTIETLETDSVVCPALVSLVDRLPELKTSAPLAGPAPLPPDSGGFRIVIASISTFIEVRPSADALNEWASTIEPSLDGCWRPVAGESPTP